MANTSQKKPVNDLIKFWADKQEKKDLEPVSRSLRRPLFPNASLPTTPLNESFFQKAPFRDIPTNSPPSTPIKQSNNIHSLISDNGNSINDIQPVNNGSLPRNESPDEDDEEISCHTPTVKNVYVKIPRDLDINTRDVVLNKAGPLPPAKKVTDLVSKFEKVTSPTNSVTTSPRLTPIKQSYPTSPLALSPIKRNKPTLEPLSLPSTINSKTKRRQTVPEPLTISLKQISDEPDLISPISPIGNKRTSPSTEQCVPEVQTQKKPVQQESQSINNNNNNNNNNTPQIHEKKVSESNPIPKPVILSIKQSDPEPIQPKQTSPASPTIQSDYLDFLTETLQSLQTTSFNSNLWDPENGDKLNKTVPEKKSHSQNKTFTNRKITKVTFDTTSNPNNNKNNTISNSNYEIPDLLPQPEPISPIRLTFSDFIISPNGSSTNLNSNDKQVGEKEKLDFLDMMSTKQSDVHKVVKPEVPKKDENYSSTKSMRHISGSIQFIESLRRYLQPNKYKNSDIVNVTTRKVASQ